jgi:hypothetical protein
MLSHRWPKGLHSLLERRIDANLDCRYAVILVSVCHP